MTLEEYCRGAAEVLRSSERMMQHQVAICKQTPEDDAPFYDPEWSVDLSQDQANGLIRNLSDAAKLLDLLGGAQ